MATVSNFITARFEKRVDLRGHDELQIGESSYHALKCLKPDQAQTTTSMHSLNSRKKLATIMLLIVVLLVPLRTNPSGLDAALFD